MRDQHGLPLNDPDSLTRNEVLSVVGAAAESVGRFDRDELFGGFAVMRALTYTPSMPMIQGLLQDYDYDEFECIFGHGNILSREVEDILAFQKVIDDRLNDGFVALGKVNPERQRLIYDRAAEGTVRFWVVKDAIAHAKIYLLESDDESDGPSRRVIVGSANLSEVAFSGRQAETLILFDDDETAWSHYSAQYEAVRDVSTNHIHLRADPQSVCEVRIEETPALRDASQSEGDPVTVYVPAPVTTEMAHSPNAILTAVERIRPVYKKALADRKPDRSGNLRIAQSNVKEMTRIHHSRQADATPQTFLSRDGNGFLLSGVEFNFDRRPDDVRTDVANWLEFFSNYENGFRGDVPRLQRDYFTFMSWFYFAPMMCDLRNEAMRKDVFSFDQPMFAVLYGSSNCGKTSLVDTLMTSMFTNAHIVDSQDFTASKLRGLQAAYKRYPVVFDDVAKDRFSRHADEIIKDEVISHDEYPCFVLSMNADTKSFKPEIVKRCLMIYTRTSLPGNLISERRSLQRSVSRIKNELTTGLYREYLSRIIDTLEARSLSNSRDVDALELSSSVLTGIFSENLPDGEPLPTWCAVKTLQEYQENSFERQRLRLQDLLHGDRYNNERKTPEGTWSTSSDKIVVSTAIIGASQLRADIPDWLIDDTASAAGQVVLNKELTEEFLDVPVRKPRRWLPWIR